MIRTSRAVGPSVVLDACVLLPPQQRNLLLQLAFEEIFEVFWTDRIIGEWLRNVEPRSDRAKCEHRTVPMMRSAFPNATLAPVGDEPMGTTDAGDLHVAQAAVSVAPCILLTWNLRDFDASALAEHGVHLSSPDEFLCRLFASNPPLVVEVTHHAAENLRKTAPTWGAYLRMLERNNLNGFVQRVRAFEHSPAGGRE